jgi:hypothetical protein
MRSRLLALGAAAGLAVLVALPGVAAATAQAPAQHSGTSVTVTGPHMCMCTVNPNTLEVTNSSSFKRPSTVTVSQVTNLTHQTIQVSWTGFTPSAGSFTSYYDNQGTTYPVMVVECQGYHPASLNNCYDTTDYGIDNGLPAYYQRDPSFAITTPSGVGETDVQVLTSLQVQKTIFCDATHPCSLVVVPSQGGVSNSNSGCQNHSQDAGVIGSNGIGPTAIGQDDFTINANGSVNPWLCSWRKRIVVPLHFAPALNDCPQRFPDFTAEGSPMLADAMTQWQTGICTGANSVEIAYNGTNNEDEARADFQSGATDVALTTLPLTGTAAHPFTYAPVAVSAVSVAYYVDNNVTGLPYTTIKLTPLLLAKQLTTSYNYGGYQCYGPNPLGNLKKCDNGVNGTKQQTIFTDPDFLKYNPGPWNTVYFTENNPVFDTPDVYAGTSDMTWELTNWIAADKNATAFLDGKPSGGVSLNSYYRGIKYPVNEINPRDPNPNMATQDEPESPLYNVVEYLVNGQQPGVDLAEQQPGTPTPPGWPAQEPGQRELWAIVDQGDAALNAFPVAYLQNAAGEFVQPTVPAMLAAVKDMTAGPDGTLSMNFARKDPAAYPLTMVIYAVVPTGGIPHAEAAAIARFLDYVANRGQQPGSAAGDLPAGYAPLPESLRQETLTAAYEVLNQTGGAKKKASSSSSTPATSPATSPSPSTSPSKSPSRSPSDEVSASSTPTAHSIAVSFASPDVAGMSWVVFALILTGGVLLITGPAALIAGSPAARAALNTGARRIIRLATRTRSHWRGVPRPARRRNS